MPLLTLPTVPRGLSVLVLLSLTCVSRGWKTYDVPMRDGVTLSTRVQLPPHLFQHKFPCVLDRSPYGHDASELSSDTYLTSGFVAIGQDQRGSGCGTFT